MDKPLACIEISNDSIKLLVGYQLNDQPVVLYTKQVPIKGCLKDGSIVDQPTLVKALSELHNIADETAKLKIVISEVCLVLPSLGLEVYQNNKTTNVVSPEAVIAKLDISNVVSLVNKESVPSGNEIVDIIPDEFVLDKGQRFVNPPLGEKSNSLTIKAKVQSLPHKIAYEYKSVINQAGFHIKKSCVAAYCYSELFKAYKDMPESYLLLDIGAKISTLTLVGNGSPYSSLFFLKGGDDLTNDIADAFGIPYVKAEELKNSLGYDPREFSFNPEVVVSMNAEGQYQSFYQKDLNEVISNFYENYETLLENAVNQILSPYGNRYDDLPIILTGGASKLTNGTSLLSTSFPKRKIIVDIPHSVGARDASYSCLLGLIQAASKYRGSLEDNHHGVISVSRQKKKEDKQHKKNKPEADSAEDVL